MRTWTRTEPSAVVPTGPLPALSRWAAAGAGVAAVGAGVAAAHLLAALTRPASSPLVAVGAAFIDLTPTWLKEFAVATFGTADKTVLLATISVLLLAAAALVGLLATWRRRTAVVLAAALGAVPAVAALSRPGASPADTLPSLAGAAIAAASLAWLTRPRRTPLRDDPSGVGDAPTPGRRSVLAGVLGLAGAALLVGGLGEVVGRRRSDVGAARAAVRLPAPVDPERPLPAGVDVGVPGVTPFRVPNADFYRVDTALVVPTLDPGSWSLEVDGMVERPFTISFDELLAMPMIERDLTLTCVSNEVGGPYAGNARWLGVRLTDLLSRAGVRPGSDMLLSRSSDGFTASTPMAAATDGRDAIVAVGMNGEPLPAEHGFPARLVVPGLYGFVSATKWLTGLTATTYAADQAYWTKRGWATDAPVRTMARIDVPRPLSTVPAGRVAVAGVCWAQHRGIDGVEVQVDDGDWRPARLGAVPSDDTWRQWAIAWDATPGRHTLRARATDATGTTQPQARLTPFPSGAQGWHEIVVTVS
ncbi:MAG: molybdopterin-dependent oxidoreductase [Frankiales bacterium]|nr:molybdopterin-dependent oxidoreductase [Frankiales bacterium]